MVQYRVVQSTSGDTEGNRSSAYTLPQNRLFSAENTAAPLSPQENHAERTERRHDGYMHGYMRGYEQEHAAFMHLSPRDLPPPATTTFGPSSPHKTHAYRPLADYYPDVADDYYAGGPGSGPMAEWFFPHQPQTPRSAAHHNYAAFATPSLGHRAEHFRSLFSPVQNRSGSVDSTISLNLEDLPSQPQQNNGGTQERGATPPHLYITPSRLFTSTNVNVTVSMATSPAKRTGSISSCGTAPVSTVSRRESSGSEALGMSPSFDRSRSLLSRYPSRPSQAVHPSRTSQAIHHSDSGIDSMPSISEGEEDDEGRPLTPTKSQLSAPEKAPSQRSNQKRGETVKSLRTSEPKVPLRVDDASGKVAVRNKESLDQQQLRPDKKTTNPAPPKLDSGESDSVLSSPPANPKSEAVEPNSSGGPAAEKTTDDRDYRMFSDSRLTRSTARQLRDVLAGGGSQSSDDRNHAAQILVSLSISPQRKPSAKRLSSAENAQKNSFKRRKVEPSEGTVQAASSSINRTLSDSSDSLTSLPSQDTQRDTSSDAQPWDGTVAARLHNEKQPSMRPLPDGLPLLKGYERFYQKFHVPSQVGPAGSLIMKSVYGPDASSTLRNVAERARQPMDGTFNEPRSLFDLYTPRYVRGSSLFKEGLCPICFEEGHETWFKMKTSALNYHLNNQHGISAVTAKPFMPPGAVQALQRPKATEHEKDVILQGKCGVCRKWVDIEGIKKGTVNVPELYWWKHAQQCHNKHPKKVVDCGEIFEKDALYKRVHEYRDAHGDPYLK